MGTLIHCDEDDCTNTNHNYDKGLFPLSEEAGEALVKKKYIFSIYDHHICMDCIENYWNEEDERLIIKDGYIEIGKDFIE